MFKDQLSHTVKIPQNFAWTFRSPMGTNIISPQINDHTSSLVSGPCTAWMCTHRKITLSFIYSWISSSLKNWLLLVNPFFSFLRSFSWCCGWVWVLLCALHSFLLSSNVKRDVNRNKWILNKVFWRLGSSAGAAVRKLNQPPGHCPGFSAQNSFLLPLYGYRTSKRNGFVGRFQLAHFWMLQKQPPSKGT